MTDATQTTQAPERPGRLAEFWFYFRENRGAVFGLYVFATFVLIAALADILAPYSPTEQFRGSTLVPPLLVRWRQH